MARRCGGLAGAALMRYALELKGQVWATTKVEAREPLGKLRRKMLVRKDLYSCDMHLSF